MHKNTKNPSATSSKTVSKQTAAAKTAAARLAAARKATPQINKEVIRKSTGHFRLVLTCIGLSILIVAVALLIENSFSKNATQNSSSTQPSQEQRSLV